MHCRANEPLLLYFTEPFVWYSHNLYDMEQKTTYHEMKFLYDYDKDHNISGWDIVNEFLTASSSRAEVVLGLGIFS